MNQPSTPPDQSPNGMTTREVVIATAVVAVAMIAMIATLIYAGFEKKNGPTYQRLAPELYKEKYDRFVNTYTVEHVDGVPVVEPPADADIYIKVYLYEYEPLLRLHKGKRYRLHLYSMDTLHGFSLPALGIRFEVPPGQEMVTDISPLKEGSYTIICDEFCGQGHHDMRSLLTVLP